MTDTTGWPDASKPGVPMNPEQDGWHWLEFEGGGAKAWAPVEWRAVPKRWRNAYGELHSAWEKARRWSYLGPCLTPQEVAAREQAAAEAMREACALDVERALYLCPNGDRCGPLAALSIRTMSLPTDELDAMLAQARREGMEEAAHEAQGRESEGGEYALAARHIAAAIRARAKEIKP